METSEIDYSKDITLLFAPRISENIRVGNQTQYVYVQPKEGKKSSIQKYYYQHPEEYPLIREMSLELNENGTYKYRVCDIAHIMMKQNGLSITTCSNEINNIRAQNPTKPKRTLRKTTLFDVYFQLHPEDKKTFTDWCLYKDENGRMYKVKDLATEISKWTKFTIESSAKYVRKTRKEALTA